MSAKFDTVSFVLFVCRGGCWLSSEYLWYKWRVFYIKYWSPETIINRRGDHVWATRVCQKWREENWKIKRVSSKTLYKDIKDPVDKSFANLYWNNLIYYSYINEYEKIRAEAASDVERYVGNPLNSYLLIKRLTSDWKEVRELVSAKVRWFYDLDQVHIFFDITIYIFSQFSANLIQKIM